MCVIHSILAGMHPWGLVEMNCPHLRVRSLRMKLKSLSSSSESPVVYYKSPLPYHMYGRPGLWGSSGRSPTVGLPFSEFVIPPPPKQPRIDQDNVSDVGSSTYSSHFPDPALMVSTSANQAPLSNMYMYMCILCIGLFLGEA